MRSGATAPASRSTGASCSSMSASCSPRPTCPASTSCSPTSRIYGRTRTASTAASRPTGTRTTSAACRSCCRDVSFPIYGSPLTLGLARSRIEEAGLLGQTELIPVADGERRQVGPFDLEFIPVTHSVPYAFDGVPHTARRRLALGRLQARPDAGRRATHRPVTHRGDRLFHRGALAAATRRTPRRPATRHPSAMSAGCSRTSSASTTAGGSLRHRSRATSTASSRSPMRRSPRTLVATLGLSVKRNVRMARELGLLHIPDASAGRDRRVADMAPGKVCRVDRLAGRADVGARSSRRATTAG